MKFEVKKGLVKRNGVFHRKGSVFDATKEEARELVASGIIAPVEVFDNNGESRFDELTNDHQPSMTLDELKRYLKNAQVEEVEAILQAELKRPEPRKKAVQMLEEWLKEASKNADEVQLPTLDADDVIVE